jgi:NAD(P)-dependent dehydrogenase (short-subunit alcohol dehydrogenase family)
VVNNAYWAQVAAPHETAPANWAHQLEVCLGQIHRSLYHLHDQLRTGSHPAMVNISSVHARVTEPGQAAYAAAKGAIEAATRQLASEYGPWLRVNAVAPGAILTRTWDGIGDDSRGRVADQTPLRRLGSPAEIARVVRFLLSEDASFVTGATVVADGGWSVSKVVG